MGNSSSSSNSGDGGGGSSSRTGVHMPPYSSLPSPFRTGTGSLGLSRSELDQRCQSSGLYPSCEWDTKSIRRLIGDGKLAARLKGSDSRLTKTDRECPICFMFCSENNVTKCCKATICTECYLQIKTQKERYTMCPFCNNPKMSVTVAKVMNQSAVAKRDEDEQRVLEATIRSRANSNAGEAPATPLPSPITPQGGETNTLNVDAPPPDSGGFGSSLENFNRARTLSTSSQFSNSSAGGVEKGTGGPGTPSGTSCCDGDDPSAQLASLAMTPEERRALESEMRAQISHPTHRRVQDEAEEARMRHQQEWFSSEAGTRQRMREGRMVELARLLQRAQQDGEYQTTPSIPGLSARNVAGEINNNRASFGQLVRSLESSGGRTGGGGGGRGRLDDLVRLEAAIFLSMEEDARRRESLQRPRRGRRASASNRTGGGDGGGAGNEEGEGSSANESELGEENEEHGRRFVTGRGVESRRRLGPISRRAGRGIGRRAVSTTHLDTAELLMRGISEDDQLAMAIALSMRDTAPQEEGPNRNRDNDGSSAAASGSEDEEGAMEDVEEGTVGDGGEEETDDEEEVVFVAVGEEGSGG